MWDYGADNRGPEMAAVSIVMAVISVVAVALRSYTMAKLLKRFLFEDLLAVVTCVRPPSITHGWTDSHLTYAL